MIIAFAWTTPALVAGHKVETRRDWSDKTIALAIRQMESQRLVDAYDQSTRAGGKAVGRIVITGVWKEDPSQIPDEAWETEGFHVLTPLGCEFRKDYCAPDCWNYGKSQVPGTTHQTVVRFELRDLTSLGGWIKRETEARLAVLQPYTLADLRRDMKGVEGWERA